MDIVMTGYVAGEGTGLLADNFEKKLLVKLPKSIVSRAKDMSLREEACEIRKLIPDDVITYEVCEGGIFAALWNVGQKNDLGITVFCKNMYIKQETVEVCEVFDINPYMLNGRGSLLIITDRGNEIVRSISDAGYYASVIGYTTNSKDRVVINNNEQRFIESRIKDEYERLIERG